LAIAADHVGSAPSGRGRVVAIHRKSRPAARQAGAGSVVVLAAFSSRVRNGLTMSIGIGKIAVVFCSAPISVSVWRR